MKRVLKNLIIFYKNDMIKVFNARTKQSEVVACVLKFLIKSDLVNYKILNV